MTDELWVLRAFVPGATPGSGEVRKCACIPDDVYSEDSLAGGLHQADCDITDAELQRVAEGGVA